MKVISAVLTLLLISYSLNTDPQTCSRLGELCENLNCCEGEGSCLPAYFTLRNIKVPQICKKAISTIPCARLGELCENSGCCEGEGSCLPVFFTLRNIKVPQICKKAVSNIFNPPAAINENFVCSGEGDSCGTRMCCPKDGTTCQAVFDGISAEPKVLCVKRNSTPVPTPSSPASPVNENFVCSPEGDSCDARMCCPKDGTTCQAVFNPMNPNEEPKILCVKRNNHVHTPTAHNENFVCSGTGESCEAKMCCPKDGTTCQAVFDPLNSGEPKILCVKKQKNIRSENFVCSGEGDSCEARMCCPRDGTTCQAVFNPLNPNEEPKILCRRPQN